MLDAGYTRVPTSAYYAKQKVEIAARYIKEAGYYYTYLSYEDQSNNLVYFDDFKVRHKRSNLIQASEYYPYGMQTANSWTRESNTANNFLYNGGTELNQTTQVYDLYYRNYDPVLGRFGQVDPMASKFASLTPYNYGNNDPVFYSDPLGDCPTCGCEVCDAPNINWTPQRAYEGGSLTPFEQFAQDNLSRMFDGANGNGAYGAGANYGMVRGLAFNERAISKSLAIAASNRDDPSKSPTDKANYSEGAVVQNKFGTWVFDGDHWVDVSTPLQLNAREEWLEANRGNRFYTELSGQISYGVQASFIPTPEGPAPVPWIRGSILGFYVNIGSLKLIEGSATSDGKRELNTVRDDIKADQGVAVSFMGLSIEYTRELKPGFNTAENILSISFLSTGAEWNVTSGSVFVGLMPGFRAAVGLGVKGEGKHGFKFETKRP